MSAEDTVVITAGVPIGQSGTTNLIEARVVEEKIEDGPFSIGPP
ncbi:MAG: hypothetical protein ACLUJG_07995 [Lawsonibacter sp.]